MMVALPAVFATRWFAAYNMDSRAVEKATASGCYRGVYGGQQPRSLSLLTCDWPDSVFIGETSDDAYLCVLELREATFLGATETIVNEDNSSTVFFRGHQELVIYNNDKPSEISELCCSVHFDGMVDNTMYVATRPIKPQDPAPLWHPRVRAVHNSFKKGVRVEPDPIIVDLINQFSHDNVASNLHWLATDYQRTNAKITRNSFSIRQGVGGCADSTWRCADNIVNELSLRLRDLFRDYPYRWSITEDRFREDMCRNLILEIDGDLDDKFILTGAHLDSRNENRNEDTTGPSPGADDNGSGSAIQLEMARVIAHNRIQFQHSMRIMWFCGEEQGLLGSRALAIRYREAGDNIIGMFNMDMIGYTDPEGRVTMSFMTGSASAELSAEIAAFSAIYVPELPTANSTVCCSDQQSFHLEGFRAAGIFETPTPRVIYPEYHTTRDTVNNGLLNYDQIHIFGKSLFSAILEYATPLIDAN
jgi:hypothetical protein